MSKPMDLYNHFTKDLLVNYAKKNENLFLSPLSILVLLCMAADSTVSDTRDEIIKAICKDESFDDFKAFITDLSKKLSDETVSVANALCVNETVADTIKPEFKKLLHDSYDAKLFASRDIVGDVNKWAKEKTKGMIDKIADDKIKDALVCLMNAICFDAKWAQKYERYDIHNEEEFKNSDGSKSSVTLLFSVENDYIENNRFIGFTKPYKGTKYSFMALLPTKESMKNLKSSLSAIDFTELFHSKHSAEVWAEIPEFRYDFSEDLSEYLQDQGINKIFAPAADFSPMTDEWVKADSIIHKAHIELNRKGIKAAAVTYMDVEAGAAIDFDRIKNIRLDRPFIYAIMHNETGLPVFTGIVNKL